MDAGISGVRQPEQALLPSELKDPRLRMLVQGRSYTI